MPEPILELCSAGRRFGEQVVLRSVDLTVQRGESVVILGRSGSGKSVLIRLLNALALPDSGRVRLFGQDTRSMTPAQRRAVQLRIGTLFQQYALFDSLSVFDNVAFPLREQRRLPPAAIHDRVNELLALMELEHAATMLPAALSGGMRKRVSLARALAPGPEVLLFDEPTTGLDPILIERVDNLLLDLRRRFDLTCLIISHDMASAVRLADRMALLEDGMILASGTPHEMAHNPLPEVQAFFGASTSRLQDPVEDLPPGSGEPPPPLTPGSQAPGESPATGLEWNDLGEPPGETVVEVRDLTRSFSGRAVLQGINLWAARGEVTTLIGGSGSGKTVLMKHLLGLLEPDSGRVVVLGQGLAGLGGRHRIQLRRRFGMLFQGAALFDSMTVLDNVAFPLLEGPDRHQWTPSSARERARETLDLLSVAPLADLMPADLSGGQRKRVGLARAMVARPEILIYDEPTTGLDPVMTATVNDMISQAQSLFGITALVVSHDMASTFRISDRIAMLFQGRIIAFGDPASIRASEHPEVRRFIFAGEAPSTD
jgi:ABC-type transporter Mla maintaining outer membrane lipid asymmetry ATPase subunit MlaF